MAVRLKLPAGDNRLSVAIGDEQYPVVDGMVDVPGDVANVMLEHEPGVTSMGSVDEAAKSDSDEAAAKTLEPLDLSSSESKQPADAPQPPPDPLSNRPRQSKASVSQASVDQGKLTEQTTVDTTDAKQD